MKCENQTFNSRVENKLQCKCSIKTELVCEQFQM